MIDTFLVLLLVSIAFILARDRSKLAGYSKNLQSLSFSKFVQRLKLNYYHLVTDKLSHRQTCTVPLVDLRKSGFRRTFCL